MIGDEYEDAGKGKGHIKRAVLTIDTAVFAAGVEWVVALGVAESSCKRSFLPEQSGSRDSDYPPAQVVRFDQSLVTSTATFFSSPDDFSGQAAGWFAAWRLRAASPMLPPPRWSARARAALKRAQSKRSAQFTPVKKSRQRAVAVGHRCRDALIKKGNGGDERSIPSFPVW